MPQRRRTTREAAPSRYSAGQPLARYLEDTHAPLNNLVFLLPIIVCYEIGSVLYLARGGSGGSIEGIKAERLIAELFNLFGAAGIHLPAITIIVVLLTAHVLSRRSWRVRPSVPLMMAGESVCWTLPFFVLAMVLAVVLSPPGQAMIQQTHGNTPLAGLPWQTKLTLAMGAGLYEELLFRLVAMNLIHAIVTDGLKFGDTAGKAWASGISAVAFALYHDIYNRSDGLNADAFLYILVMGLCFSFVFIRRGFGICVGVHVLFDVLALLKQG